jgi:preprotein translocase subunit SecF
MHILKNANFDFLKWRWHALVLSWIVIAAGIAVIMTRGLPMGVEFAGGTVVVAQFDQQPSIQQVRSAISSVGGENAVVNTYGDPAQRQIMIRVPEVGSEGDQGLAKTANAVVNALKAANLGGFQVIGTEIVGPAVGSELTSKGISATVLSLAGILIYLTIRYQFSFAMGAVVATIHDLLVTFAFLAFFRYDLTLNVIAAILTVAGYSGNDTIVVFDRVRENLRSMRRDSLSHVINVSVNQTLARTIITAGLTFLAVVALYLFGGEVLRGFAFTLLVGIVTGTYSTVFIAGSIVTFWHGKGSARAAAHAPAPPAVPQQPARKTKPARKARAS